MYFLITKCSVHHIGHSSTTTTPSTSPANPALSLHYSQLYRNMDAAALNNLTPDQVNAVKAQAQQQANMSVTQALMKSMAELCFHKCAGSSVRNVDTPQEKAQMV